MSMKSLAFFAFAAASIPALAQDPTRLFADKPYTLNLATIQAFDPKPLQTQAFSPEPAHADRAKGLRILSRGRVFPIDYEVISVQGAKPEVLDAVSKSLEGRDGIVMKDFVSSPLVGNCLHYFERSSVDGKPHHVSSNYLFYRNGTFYHFMAVNFGPALTHRESWGPAAADGNSENEVKLLLKAASFKDEAAAK